MIRLFLGVVAGSLAIVGCRSTASLTNNNAYRIADQAVAKSTTRPIKRHSAVSKLELEATEVRAAGFVEDERTRHEQQMNRPSMRSSDDELSTSPALIDAPSKDTKDVPAASAALKIAGLETMALTNNPTLVQSTAQVRAAHAAAYQAGRYPNPVAGYTAEQIGINGTAGEFQGGFVGQEFVTAGKLRLSRQKYAQRARIAETNRQAQQQRVLNDVHIAFYRTLAAQRLVEIHKDLLNNGEDNLQTHKEMLNLGQTNQAGLLQAEVDVQQDRLDLNASQNSLQRAWREMASLVGIPDLKRRPLADQPVSAEEPLAWDAALNQLMTQSPELIASWEKVQHDQIAVERERVEPIPNIRVDVNVGRNVEAGQTVSGVSVGFPLPIYDRNRGTVRQALADLSRSRAETRRLELELRTRLAAHYRDYETAWQHVDAYRTIMLPKAKMAFDLLHASYKKRRAAWPDVLRAQRRYLGLRAKHTNNILRYREADVAIRGMLLTGGLTEPAGPIGGGHIDATPKPR